MRAYVATRSVPGGSISSVRTPTVIKVAFMTEQEASELIQNFVSSRNDDLVCYVHSKESSPLREGRRDTSRDPRQPH